MLIRLYARTKAEALQYRNERNLTAYTITLADNPNNPTPWVLAYEEPSGYKQERQVCFEYNPQIRRDRFGPRFKHEWQEEL